MPTDADVAAPARAGQQQEEADHLAETGGQCGASYPHAEGEDEHRVQNDVEHRAGGNADHGVKGAALEAQLVVEHQAGDQERRTGHEVAQIRLGIGRDGGRGPKGIGQRVRRQQAEGHNSQSYKKRAEKAGGGHLARICRVSRAQHARHVVA